MNSWKNWRMAGITDLSQVKYAVLETTGRISVLPYAEARPVTNQAMGLKVQEKGLPTVVVSDGRVLSKNLRARNCPWVGSKGSWPNGALQMFAECSYSRWMRRGTCI